MAFGRESVIGLSQVKALFKQLPADVQTRLYEGAIEPTGEAVLSDAKRNLRPGHGLRTGGLRDALDISRSPKTGFVKVGIKKTVLDISVGGLLVRYRPSSIGHLVEYGHGGPHPAPAYAFMVPAAEGQRSLFAQRATRALKQTETDMAARGGRLL